MLIHLFNLSVRPHFTCLPDNKLNPEGQPYALRIESMVLIAHIRIEHCYVCYEERHGVNNKKTHPRVRNLKALIKHKYRYNERSEKTIYFGI